MKNNFHLFLTFIITVAIIVICFLGIYDKFFEKKYESCYEFKKAYCKIGEVWYDFEIQYNILYSTNELQLRLEDGTIIFIDSSNCILYNGQLLGVNEKE